MTNVCDSVRKQKSRISKYLVPPTKHCHQIFNLQYFPLATVQALCLTPDDLFVHETTNLDKGLNLKYRENGKSTLSSAFFRKIRGNKGLNCKLKNCKVQSWGYYCFIYILTIYQVVGRSSHQECLLITPTSLHKGSQKLWHTRMFKHGLRKCAASMAARICKQAYFKHTKSWINYCLLPNVPIMLAT